MVMGGRKGDQDDRKSSVDIVSELEGRGTAGGIKAPRKPTNSSPAIEFGTSFTIISLVAKKN
jgi:hypothetical protein